MSEIADIQGVYLCQSETETIALGEELGKKLKPGSVICFFGDLGAGKTTFIKGLVVGTSHVSQDLVNSPTYVYLNIYQGQKTVYHFDLYRLRDEDEFLSMGFDEFLFAGGICCFEWSERIKTLLPTESLSVEIIHAGEFERLIKISLVSE